MVTDQFENGVGKNDAVLAELKKTRAMKDLLADMNKTTSAERLFSLSTEGILQILGADRVAILTFDEDNQLDFRAASGLSKEYQAAVHGHFPWRRETISAQPIQVQDVNQADFEEGLKKTILDEGIQSISFFPLTHDEALVGKFVVYCNQPRFLVEDEVATAMTIAESLSAALSRIKNRAGLVESERKYRGIVENIAEGVYQSTPDGRFITVNRALVDMLGYAEESEVLKLNLPVDLYFHPSDRERLVTEVDHKGRLRNIELKIRRKDGSPLFVLMNDRAVRDEKGNIIRYEGTLENISEHRRIEDALRMVAGSVSALTGTQFFEVLVEHLARVLVADVSFVGQLIYKDNQAWIKTIAVFSDGKKAENFEYPLANSPCETIIRNGAQCYQEFLQEQFPLDDMLGDLGSNSYLGVPLCSSTASPLGLVAILNRRAMTQTELPESILKIFASRAAAELERQISEENKRQMEIRIQHEQKIKSVGVLAGGIAHEFNNILVGILGYADLALMEVPHNIAARESLEKIKGAGQRAAELTRQLLAYSGQGKFVVEPLSLTSLVRNMSELLMLAVPRKISLMFDLKQPLPAVEGDSKQIGQILLSLVSNASEAIGNGIGKITIKTRHLEMDQDEVADTLLAEHCSAGEFVMLEVVDDGPGMDTEVKERIFEPFYSTKFAGRGLGLAAVQGIVRGHHGTLSVHSDEGEGTHFRIYLPVSGREPLREDTPLIPAAANRILLIDDEQDVRDIAGKILERAGYAVTSASDGIAGVEAFEEAAQEYSLVILDLMMPGLNGDEVFARIQKIRSDIPVVLISGYNQHEASRKFQNWGLHGFIQKPFTAKYLVEVVGRIFDQNNQNAN